MGFNVLSGHAVNARVHVKFMSLSSGSNDLTINGNRPFPHMHQLIIRFVANIKRTDVKHGLFCKFTPK